MLETVIVFLALALDQGSKFLAMSELAAYHNGVLELWPGVFHFTYVQNYGAAFGSMQNMRWLFLITTPIVAGILIYYLVKHRAVPRLLRVALALLLAGALGNFIDRLLLGYVRDFLHVALINFAVFNVADSCVTVGAVLFAWYILFRMGKEKKDEKKDDAAAPSRVSSPKHLRMLRRERMPASRRPVKRHGR